ncbi:MAG: threonine/serine exporter family protein [Prolixibacteraceae bacterium]|nr:threonine/serine exporter family protein [Prolixibacteraceae bacterium]
MEILQIIEKGFWSGIAALGFAVLFNVPVRTLFAIWMLGAIGGIMKFFMVDFWGLNLILASFIGATAIGIVSIPLAHKIHSPPLIFSIPSVIPMVPGAFFYRMMLGLIKISAHTNETGMGEVLAETVQYGLKVTFILLSLAVGVAVPMLITRKESAKRIKIKL